MLFDHDPELGAVLCVDHVTKQINGYFYRWDESRNLHYMTVKGVWKPTSESDIVWIRALDLYLKDAPNFMENRDKLNWLIAADWIEDKAHRFIVTDADHEIINANLESVRNTFNGTDVDGGLQKYLDLLDTYEYITE